MPELQRVFVGATTKLLFFCESTRTQDYIVLQNREPGLPAEGQEGSSHHSGTMQDESSCLGSTLGTLEQLTGPKSEV